MLDDLTDWFDEEGGEDPSELGVPDVADFDFEADLPGISPDAELNFTDVDLRGGTTLEPEQLQPELSVEFGRETDALGQSELSFAPAGGRQPPADARPPAPPWMAEPGTADPRAAPGVAQASPAGEYPRLSTRRGALREGPGIG